MGTQRFKAPLNAAKFPFLYSHASRSVLQPQLDIATRTPQAFFGSMTNADYNLIQLLYAENVIPSSTGLQSVSVKEEISAFTPATTDFDQFIVIRDSDENNVLFSPGRGKNYVYNTSTQVWESKNPFVWNALYSLVSKAYVNGRTFICYESERVIEWQPGTSSFSTIALTLPGGFVMADIKGISGASNYLIAFTTVEILWSSLVTITNFNDPTGGSGRQIPQDLKGPITSISPISGGFLIFTTRNVVAAFFTNNPAAPFLFKEVLGSGGVQGPEQVTGDANSNGYYTYGSSGVQLVTLQKAETVLPDLADFLVSREYETWDATAGEVTNTMLTDAPRSKLVFLANRYLLISYGWIVDHFTYILLYDTALDRWGKIKVTHVDAGILPLEAGGGAYRYYALTDYDDYTLTDYEDLTESYGSVPPLRAGYVFLENTGRVTVLLADTSAENSQGVALFGHVQVTRSRKVTFQGASIDGLFSVPAPRLRLLLSDDGYNRETVVDAVVAKQTPKHVQYEERKTGENFDIVIEGRFDLSTLIVDTTVHGSR